VEKVQIKFFLSEMKRWNISDTDEHCARDHCFYIAADVKIENSKK